MLAHGPTLRSSEASPLAIHPPTRGVPLPETRGLNTELLLSPTFQDATIRPGISYRYAVNAVDRKGNESARSGTVLVRP